MKKILAIFAALALAACSGDDDNKEVAQNKYLSTITLSEDETPSGDDDVLTFFYDDKKHISSIVSEDEIVASFEYEGDNVISISTDDGASERYGFGYTNGVFSQIRIDGQMLPVTFNAQENSYTIGTINASIVVSGRDFTKALEADSSVYADVTYDNSKKGALYNIAGNNLFVMTFFSNLFPYIATKPMAGLRIGSDTYTTANTYDSDGYIVKSVLTSTEGESQVLIYSYKAL